MTRAAHRNVFRPGVFCLAVVGAAAVVAGAGSAARAVVVDTQGPQGAPPTPLTQAANVGLIGNTTGVYLGNGWVITAAHVGAGPIAFSAGTFYPIEGTYHRLTTGSAQADLIVYRVSGNVGLSPLTLASAAPAVNAPVTLIGNGKNQATELTYYSVTGTPSNYTWTETSAGQANAAGYKLVSGNTKTTGTNNIGTYANGATTSDVDDGFGITSALVTSFNSGVSRTEAQVVSGDSGGGMFADDGMLVGILFAAGSFSNQPSAAIYGQASYAANIAAYRTQISAIISPALQGDFNGDGQTDAADYTVWADHFGQNFPAADGNGDGIVNAADYTVWADHFGQGGPPSGTGGPGDGSIPEPAAAGLPVLSVVLSGRRRRQMS